MKRLLFLTISLSITFSHALWAKAPQTLEKQQTFAPFTGKIIGNKVRLRLSPNLEGQIIRELERGEIYAVVAENNEYYGVTPKKDVKAYIFRTHVLDNHVEGEKVNIRTAASLDAPVLAQLNAGEKVNIDPNGSKGKWYQIEVPKNVHLWVAKDYVEKVGPLEYAEKYSERVNEATQLLATATLISQAEFRKSFQEVDLDRITRNYERVLKDYSDLDDIHLQAKQAIQSLQKEYCDRKIEFLENKAGRAALEVKSLNAKLTHLKTPDISSEAKLSMDSPFANILDNQGATDKMKIWQPIEYAKFQSWAFRNEKNDATLQDFYQAEFLDAKTLSGLIEPFRTVVKSKPGSHLLTKDGQTVGYLYSTHINLSDFIDKNVSLKVTERENHNFAFPAYYVLDVKQE